MSPLEKFFYEYGKAYGLMLGTKASLTSYFERSGLSCREAVKKCNRCLKPMIVNAWERRAVSRRTCSECQTYALLVKKPNGGVWCPDAEINTNGNARCVGCPFFGQMKGGRGI